MIIGVGLGLLMLILRRLTGGCFTIREQLPFLYTMIKYVSDMASPFALIVMGGQFRFSAAGAMKREITVAVLFRIVAAPVLAITAAVLLNWMGITRFSGAEYAAFIALFATPVAVSSAIMAEEMNNDGQLASQLVVWTNVCSVFTIFGFIIAAKLIGLL